MAVSFFHSAYVMDKYASLETAGQTVEYTVDIRDRIYMPMVREKLRPDVLFSGAADLTPYKLIVSHRQMTLDEGDFLEKILPWVENGGTWVVGPYTDIFTKDLARYRNAPFGHLEDWARVERTYYVPAPSQYMQGVSDVALPILVMEDGSETRVVSNLCFDALTPKEGVRILARYKDFEYLDGFAAITETAVGRGRIILMGAQLDAEDYRRFIKRIASECGIMPITLGSDNVQVNILEGDYGTVFTAIECEGRSGEIVIPFDCADIDTGEKYFQDQRLFMEEFRSIFAKRT